jgi:hypothetical protein
MPSHSAGACALACSILHAPASWATRFGGNRCGPCWIVGLFVCLQGRRSFCLPHRHGALPLLFRWFGCAINRTRSPAWSKQSRPSSGCSTRPPHLPCGTLAMVTPRPAPEPPAEPSLALRWARVGLEGALSRGQWIDRIHCCGEGLLCLRRTPMEPFAWFGVMRRRGLGQANRLCRAPGQLCGRVPVCVHPCI